MPGHDRGAGVVRLREILEHAGCVMRRVQTQKDEPDSAIMFRVRQDRLANLLERIPGKRTAIGIGASAVEKRKQRDRPGRIAGEHTRKTISLKHDRERHALNMIEPVASGRWKL